MSRVFNFSAGPSTLPEDVLKRAQAELLDWNNCGMSPMEVGHRSHVFSEMTERCEATLRELLNIPSHYHVLFLSGGATSQFAMVPMNLLRDSGSAAYLKTGHWSKKAGDEATRYCDIHQAGQLIEENGYKRLPREDEIDCPNDMAYLYFTDNETIDGVEFKKPPICGNVPLVSDMTSNFLSRPIDVDKFGVIFASSQKNFGHAGVTVVIVRDDLVGDPLAFTPTMYNYKTHADAGSKYNTPPTYAWYFASLMFDWIKEQGGVEAMEKKSKAKINTLYHAVDHSDFYLNPVQQCSRSTLNVPFTLSDPSLDSLFIEEAKQHNLCNLKGHRSVGGMRASVYLAMTEQGVNDLVDFMIDFEKRNG